MTKKTMDITNAESLIKLMKKFEGVINCAAYSKVDKAERN